MLIAEDNKNILKRYTKYLDKNKRPHITFLNGIDCLSYIKTDILIDCNLCEKKILLTDLHMPFMDGIELAKEVRLADVKKRFKIILLSADEPSDDFKAKSLFDEI
mmetsp:Transcript_41665/g.35073  ORF Transcript_41665/g.35073 Transcript_41665/m.35073 type:complete len:105 (+) Transcript_41665:1816-2130(+)